VIAFDYLQPSREIKTWRAGFVDDATDRLRHWRDFASQIRHYATGEEVSR